MDVLGSHSWSLNVCGRKLWRIYPQLDEPYDPLVSKATIDPENNTQILEKSCWHFANDLSEHFSVHALRNRPHIVYVQEPGEIMFIPSGWTHEVLNLTPCISINRNFSNGTNVTMMYAVLRQNLYEVETTINPQCFDQVAVCLLGMQSLDMNRYIAFLVRVARNLLHRWDTYFEFTNDFSHDLFKNEGGERDIGRRYASNWTALSEYRRSTEDLIYAHDISNSLSQTRAFITLKDMHTFCALLRGAFLKLREPSAPLLFIIHDSYRVFSQLCDVLARKFEVLKTEHVSSWCKSLWKLHGEVVSHCSHVERTGSVGSSTVGTSEMASLITAFSPDDRPKQLWNKRLESKWIDLQEILRARGMELPDATLGCFQ